MKLFSFLFPILWLSTVLLEFKVNSTEQHSMPMKLVKAGARLKPELVKNEDIVETMESDTVDESNEGDLEYDSAEYEDIDPNAVDNNGCNYGYFWHIRGRRCVPNTCESNKRDPVTGQCRPVVEYRAYRNSHVNYYPRRSSYGGWIRGTNYPTRIGLGRFRG